MPLLRQDEVEDWVPQARSNGRLIDAAIAQAEAMAARYCERDSFGSDTYTEYHSLPPRTRLIFLRNYPVTAVTSVKEDAQETSPTTLATTDYIRDDTHGIFQKDGGHWCSGHNQVEIIYTAGYTNSTLPDDLRAVLLELVGWRIGFRGNRGNTSVSIDGQSETREKLVRGIPESIASQLDDWRRLQT